MEKLSTGKNVKESSAWGMSKAHHNGTKSRRMHLNGWICKLIKVMKHCERWESETREGNFLWDNWTWTVGNRVVGWAWLDRFESLAAAHFWLISYQTFDFPQTLARSTSCFQFYLELNSVVFSSIFQSPRPLPDSRHSERKRKRARKDCLFETNGKLIGESLKTMKREEKRRKSMRK